MRINEQVNSTIKTHLAVEVYLKVNEVQNFMSNCPTYSFFQMF